MKRTILAMALAAVLLAGAAAPAAAAANDAWTALLDKTVTSIEQLTTNSGDLAVLGTSSIAVEPDMASIMLGVSIEDASVVLAQEKAAAVMQSVIDALKTLGIDQNKMSTSNYSIFPTYDYAQEPAALRGYHVSNMLTVQVQEFALISQVIDRAVLAGANQVHGITFDTSKRSELYREALRTSIAAAREKAAIMAFAAGKQLGALRSLTEADQNLSMFLGAYDVRPALSAGGPQILGGELNVTAQVTLVFEMK